MSGFPQSDPLNLPLTGGTLTGELVAPDFSVSGLTGAVTPVRFVGGTANGAPTSGTFAVGDFVVDLTATFWVCVVAGTPGTWSPSVSQDLVLRSATATAAIGEYTLFSGSTAAQTITLPANPQAGAEYRLTNAASVAVSIKGGTNSLWIAGTIYGAATSVSVPVNLSYYFVFSGGVWYALTVNGATTVSGVLGIDTAVANNQTLTLMTTAALAIGTWLFEFGFTYVATGSPPNSDIEAYMATGTATATFAGAQNTSNVSNAGGQPISSSAHFLVTVTVAGTLIFAVHAGSAAAGTVKAVSGLTSLPNTGYVGVKIA